MSSIIIGHVISGLLLLIFLILIIIGSITKSRYLLFSGVIVFVLMIGVLGYTTIVLARKAIHAIDNVKNPFAGRNGKEIYTALLGKPSLECVEVLNYLDAEIPVMDYAICLHFKTCSKEFRRIINQRTYTLTKGPSSDSLIQPGVAIKWFKTSVLGDSIYSFRCVDRYGVGYEIYSSLDSTEVLLVNYSN